MSNKILKDKKGVTLIETLVALSMLVIGLVSALSLMTSSIVFSRSSEDSLVVVNLARENIEFLRSMRSLNGFSSLSSGSYIVQTAEDGSLSLDSVTGEIAECTNCRLYLVDGRYEHAGTAENLTRYRRMVTISNIGSTEKEVISQVYWTERGREHNYTLEIFLTDW